MKTKTYSTITLLLLITLFASFAPAYIFTNMQEWQTSLLLDSYLRFAIIRQIAAQASEMAESSPEAVRSQVNSYMKGWESVQIQSIRNTLISGLGENAKTDFESFVTEFTQAESDQDPVYLHDLAVGLGFKLPLPEDYNQLRMEIINAHLKDDIDYVSSLLGDVQTWIQLAENDASVPTLNIWLSRDDKTVKGKKEAKEYDPLRDAEAPAQYHEVYDQDGGNPMDAFVSSRRAKREQVMRDAEEGMRQVAAERRAAEEEYAAKKKAAADKEAAAMKAHAAELAAVEKEALEQRKRSWGNRIKRIFGSVISSTGGAFLGGIGERAGAEASDAIFNQ